MIISAIQFLINLLLTLYIYIYIYKIHEFKSIVQSFIDHLQFSDQFDGVFDTRSEVHIVESQLVGFQGFKVIQTSAHTYRETIVQSNLMFRNGVT